MTTNTPSLMADNTAKQFGDGTKRLLVTTDSDLLFGFGATEPTVWHKYTSTNNSKLNVGTDFGKIWFWSPIDITNNVYITVGA